MKINIINNSKHQLPSYATEGSAGLDLRANLEDQEIIAPGERKLISTGLHIELPVGYEAQIRPRSGLAYKKGITVLNSPGTIDSDYRGEIKVLLINHSSEGCIIEDGERISQMVIAPYSRIEWNQSEELMESARGEGGYGSTGQK